MKKDVLIIHRFLPQYRVDFYNQLRERLREMGINLNLIYGKVRNEDSSKNDEVELDWAKYIPNRIIKFGKIYLIYQPCLKEAIHFDLVIAEQANKILLNYFLIPLRKLFKFKLAFWGHGQNHQDSPESISNLFKKMYSVKCDWWFAYTTSVRNMLISFGFPENKITTVNNAIDTKFLIKNYNEINGQDRERRKQELGIGSGPVGIFCGGIYFEKRIDFLISACKIIKLNIPDFEMVFIGAGPEKFKVENYANELSWIHYFGTKFGEERIRYFEISDLLLMPGLVGLVILDAFALQTPLITTKYPFHSPEIDYLVNGVNGVMTEDSPEEYAGRVVEILKDSAYLSQLKKGCSQYAQKYTLQDMVNNFSEGIIQILKDH